MCDQIVLSSSAIRAAVLPLILVSIVCATGCNRGPVPTYPVSGRVVFGDKAPLPGGNIEFSPVDGKVRTSARGMIAEDGTFTLTTFRDADGAIEGKHRVLIIP